MKKYSEEYFRERERIQKDFIKPLLDAINAVKECDGKASKFSPIEFIQNMMLSFQYGAAIKDHLPNINYMSIWLKTLLQGNTHLEDPVNKLRLYYVDGNMEERAIRGTMVRELLMEELNLFPEFKPTKIDTITITIKDEATEMLPDDLHRQISGFFQNNPETIKNYSYSAKKFYATQKKHQDALHNVFYAVTKPIAIEEFVSAGGFDDGHTERRKVSDEDMLEAVKAIKPDETVLLFRTAHEAIEYAHTLKTGGRYGDSDSIGSIPGVMMVSTIGDSAHLQFEDRIFDFKRGSSSSYCYTGNHSRLWASVAEVSAEYIQPLVAISLYNEQNFGSYHIFNKQLHLNPLPLLSKTSTPKELFDYLLLELTLKAQDLFNRGYPDESDALLQYLKNLSTSLEQFKVELNKKSVNKEDALQAFKLRCEEDYEAIKKVVENHRGYNHIITELFLSAITLGVYLVAMIANKLLGEGNRFTFFSTDSVNKLDRLQHQLHDYLNNEFNRTESEEISPSV